MVSHYSLVRMKKTHYSKKRKAAHILTRIKIELELSQASIPDVLGISLDSFKRITTGRRKKWEKEAQIISLKTGVAVKCLLGNQVRIAATDGSQWTGEKGKLISMGQNANDLQIKASAGRHALQWFRIVMIKVARCMLAGYKDKQPPAVLFWELNRAIGKVGKSLPSYIKPEKDMYEVLPGGAMRLRDKVCPLEKWDHDLQSKVHCLKSTDKKGMEIVFDAFMEAVLNMENNRLYELTPRH